MNRFIVELISVVGLGILFACIVNMIRIALTLLSTPTLATVLLLILGVLIPLVIMIILAINIIVLLRNIRR